MVDQRKDKQATIICGILALVFGWFPIFKWLSFLSIILGIATILSGINVLKEEKSWMTMIGLVCGIIGLGLGIGFIIIILQPIRFG